MLITVVEKKIGKVWSMETVLIMIFQVGNVRLIDAIKIEVNEKLSACSKQYGQHTDVSSFLRIVEQC